MFVVLIFRLVGLLGSVVLGLIYPAVRLKSL